MKKTIVASIIAKSQKELNLRIKKVDSLNRIQLDVMDGKFVKNKSLMFPLKLPKGKKYEAHLMVNNPKAWINKNYKKVNAIIFHIESTKKPEEIIKLVKSKKKQVGIAINPKTSIERIKPYLNQVNMILVMTVTPGKYGSKFLPNTLNKIKQLRKLKSRLNIEVDGGISNKTINLAKRAGANSFVSGSYLQNSENLKKAVRELRK